MKVLAYTSPARGHLYPLVPILLELRDRGHDIAVRTLADEVPNLRRLWMDAEVISPAINDIVLEDYLARSPVAAVKRAAEVFARRAPHEVEDLRAAIATEQPDTLVVDANCWGAAAVAESWGGPWSSMLPYPAPLPSRDTPPFGPGFPPARHAAGRFRDRVLSPMIIGSLEKGMLPALNAARMAAGAERVRDAHDMLTRAPLTLYLTAEPFEYPRSDWPSSYKLVGPTSYEPTAEAPGWLADVDRPIVLVTTSSEFQNDGALVSAALAGLADEDVFVVATLPAGSPDAYDVPANARVERFMAHSQVLPYTTCAVTHGGMGSTQKALAAGVPVVAVPFGRDQSEVARRVEVAHAGTRLSSRRLSPDRLRAKVREAMLLRDGARAVAAAFHAAGGAAQAATEVEILARAAHA